MPRVGDSSKPQRSVSEDKPASCKEVFFGKRARKYAFLFIVFFLALLTIKDVVELVQEYAEVPTESDINIRFNDSMTMPNVTFCMSKKQAWSHFKINESASVDEWDQIVEEGFKNMTDHDSFMSSLWDFRLVMEAYDMIATYNSLERETTAHGSARSINNFRKSPRFAGKRKTFKKWLDVLESRKVTFAEFTQKTGTEVIRRSMQRFQRTTFNEDLVVRTRLRTSWISQMQICFQPWFDIDNFPMIEDQGNFFTMLLSHNPEVEELDCMTVDFHGRPSSINRYMEGKGRARDGVVLELCAGMRHEVTVEVRALYSMLENDDEGTACRDVEEGEDTEFDCRSRCRMTMIREMCNCTGLSLSYLAKDLGKYPLCDYTKCEIDVQNGNFSDNDCANNCRRDCRQIRYEVDHDTQGRMVRPDLTLVNLNWGSFEYLTMEQKLKYTVAAFIAALGGSIGMWLGLSILSLIQGGTYLYSWFSKRIVKEKLMKKMHERQQQRKNSRASEGSAAVSMAGRKISMAANPFENPFAPPSPSPAPSPVPGGDRRPVPPNAPGFSTNPNPTKIQVD